MAVSVQNTSIRIAGNQARFKLGTLQMWLTCQPMPYTALNMRNSEHYKWLLMHFTLKIKRTGQWLHKKIHHLTYPLSLIDSSCLLLSLLGSPLESTATASSSSNDGARNRSRIFRCLLLLRARERDEPLLSVDPATLPPWNSFPPVEFWCWCWCIGGFDTVRGGGRIIGNVFQWYRNCSATCNIIFDQWR